MFQGPDSAKLKGFGISTLHGLRRKKISFTWQKRFPDCTDIKTPKEREKQE